MCDEAQMEMPRYKCHKVVWALCIAAITEDNSDETEFSGEITPAEKGYAPFRVGGDYLRKHNPKVGGYYIRYKGGYESFSPAAAFEDGYTAE